MYKQAEHARSFSSAKTYKKNTSDASTMKQKMPAKFERLVFCPVKPRHICLIVWPAAPSKTSQSVEGGGGQLTDVGQCQLQAEYLVLILHLCIIHMVFSIPKLPSHDINPENVVVKLLDKARDRGQEGAIRYKGDICDGEIGSSWSVTIFALFSIAPQRAHISKGKLVEKKENSQLVLSRCTQINHTSMVFAIRQRVE